MEKKQAEFWVTLLGLMIIVAIAVLFLDFGIKTAILDESVKLRRLIEETYGRSAETADANGTDDDPADDTVVPGDVLVVKPAGMETGHIRDGGKAPVPETARRRSRTSGANRASQVPSGDKQVGTCP